MPPGSMRGSMAVPSFAFATTSSNLKASQRTKKSADATVSEKTQRENSPKGNPTVTRKLKRPSTLSKQDRDIIAYNADLHFIKALNPSKPCPLAALPSELRTLIYSHILDGLQRPILMNYGRKRQSPPALLQICRAIRIEAAYTYYTCTSFTWIVKNLNFTTIAEWLGSLQSSHRALLSRNQNLAIEIITKLQNSYTYPPKGFLLDDTIENHWKACQPFGNLYNVRRMRTDLEGLQSTATHDDVRIYFILFCRLASWLKFRSQSVHPSCRWNYTFDMPQDNYSKRGLSMSLSHNDGSFSMFLRHQLKKLWVRNRCEDKIKQPILEMADAFIEAYENMEGQVPIAYPMVDMVGRLKAQRQLIESW